MSVGVVVPAAGRGERLGSAVPKALQPLAGVPLLVHALRAVTACPDVGPVVVAAPTDRLDEVRRLLAREAWRSDVRVVAGGEERAASVAAGLAALPPDAELVLVHDAARCLVPPAVVDRVVAALRAGAPAVVPAVAVADTVKEVDGAGRVLRTVDRADLRAVQTPQGFAREVLARAHREAPAATDDAAMVEALGIAVATVPGDEEAFKVTRPLDLLLAEAVLARRRG